MAIDNTVTITGNATREPELRFTPSGQAVANFGVAVNRRWQNRQTQEWEEAVSFFDVTCWASLAENVAESVAKGTRITVAGRLDQRSWETQEGDKRSKVEIVADDVAVSLRWATADVVRNERPDGGGGGGGGRPSGGGGGNSPGGNAGPPPYNPDEEPF
ncbi:MAG: single-stranded DNA-binding protein [Acidimicrobiia bacterium]|nr:single-stranded DNA-binding protein [Acidimicrobiia bacterium]